MENQIVYSSAETPMFAEWGEVISGSDIRAKKLVGELMQVIELMGLQSKQESALKSKVKEYVYGSVNTLLERLSYRLCEMVSGELKYIKPVTEDEKPKQ